MNLFKSVILTSLIVLGLQHAYAADSEAVSYTTVSNDLDGSIGKDVRWFGLIIETTTLGDSDHKLVVNQVPQSEPDVPMSTKYSEGRFTVRAPFTLDTLAYQSERMISVLGTVTGVETRKVGNTSTTIPVITAIQIGLWQREVPQEPYRCRSTMSNSEYGRSDDTYAVPCDNDGNFWKEINIAGQK